MANLPKVQRVLFKIPNGSGGVDAVTVDACITEAHTITNMLTDHPVERGASITDHSRPEPRRLQLECVVTNTPLSPTPDGTDRAAAMWKRLVALHESPKLIEVQTVRDYYNNMGVESVSSPVDVKSAQCLRFTMALKQVRVVQNKFTRVVVAQDTRAHPVKKKGKATVQTAPATTADRSALAKLTDAFAGHTVTP